MVSRDSEGGVARPLRSGQTVVSVMIRTSQFRAVGATSGPALYLNLNTQVGVSITTVALVTLTVNVAIGNRRVIGVEAPIVRVVVLVEEIQVVLLPVSLPVALGYAILSGIVKHGHAVFLLLSASQ